MTAEPFPTFDAAAYRATHFGWAVADRVGTVTLDRPERKNPLTFASYDELAALFRRLPRSRDVRAVVVTGAGGNFSSGGDVHEIIGPLVRMQEAGDAPGLLRFTRMTGELVKAMRACPQPSWPRSTACARGAGAIVAMASTCAWARRGAGALPVRARRAVGRRHGGLRAAAAHRRAGARGELLYTGRFLGGEEAERWGFHNRLVAPDASAPRPPRWRTSWRTAPPSRTR
jgi:enoyl-CoA hydratase/carnithine racemase